MGARIQMHYPERIIEGQNWHILEMNCSKGDPIVLICKNLIIFINTKKRKKAADFRLDLNLKIRRNVYSITAVIAELFSRTLAKKPSSLANGSGPGKNIQHWVIPSDVEHSTQGCFEMWQTCPKTEKKRIIFANLNLFFQCTLL